ncbi:MAG: prepilin peptidase [Candidatus Micrarchaeota archaeon]|nr:prepilin peptidase [Candidatus Micrarchaeota archaeon]
MLLENLPAELPGLEVRIAIAVVFTAAAAYFDAFRNKWVPNKLVYSFAICAVIVNLIFYSQASIYAFAIGIAVFAITYLLYKAGQIGGADVFVLSSISLCIPYFSSSFLAPKQTTFYPFILSVLLPASILFIIHMLTRFLPYAARLVIQGKVRLSLQRAFGPMLLLLSFTVFMQALSLFPAPFSPLLLLLFWFLFLSLLFFSFFKEEIKASMVEELPPDKLEEEDVLALERIDPVLVKSLGLKPLLSQEQIIKLRQANLSKIPVYTKMPFFLPYLFFGLLFALLFGDLFLYLFPY